MDKKSLKLQLIQRVLQTEDAEVLQTALRVLELGGDPTGTSLTGQEPPGLQKGQPPQDEEAKQLQREIDELFNLGE